MMLLLISYATTAARRVKNCNETPPTHNNRSCGIGGVSIDSVNVTIDFINERFSGDVC
jgi:hypothetical protein